MPRHYSSFAGASPPKQLLLRVAEDPERPGEVSPNVLNPGYQKLEAKSSTGIGLRRKSTPNPVSPAFDSSGFHKRRMEDRS
jgi:hypothetical protein